MTTNTDVRTYSSTMSGAPVVSGTAGTLIALLDALGTDGFGSVTLTSLVVYNEVATATKNGHGFALIGGTTYPVIRIAGADVSALNGDVRLTGSDANTFWFPAPGVANQTVTGTITAKRAPFGMTKLYSGTSKAVYRLDRMATNGHPGVLRVDDSETTYATLVMAESASSVDTVTGPTPTTGSYYAHREYAAGSTARAWRVFADPLGFYLFVDSYGGYYRTSVFFGQVIPHFGADAYHCALIAGYGTGYSQYMFHRFNDESGAGFLRGISQSGSSAVMRRFSHGRTVTYMGWGGQAYQSPAINQPFFFGWPVAAWDMSAPLERGILPGLINPVHNGDISDGTVENAIPQLSGHDVFVQRVYDYSAAGFDITGPWR